MPNILISNVGFGDAFPQGLEYLKSLGNVCENTAKKRFSEKDFIDVISNKEILVAGTETISRPVLKSAKKLKLICRVGVGVDNIDLEYAHQKKISISYTPDAPSESVPEFTVALLLNLIKGIHASDRQMHVYNWHRPMGHMLASMTVGIIGVGKIGKRVIQLIKSISPSTNIFYYDPTVKKLSGVTACDLSLLLSESDVVSVHVPLNIQTRGLINRDCIKKMKPGSYLINTSRGGIVDEDALYTALDSNHLAGAALDVFNVEPYKGPLSTLDNCLLTSHIGSMTFEVRQLMEKQVIEDIKNFLEGKKLVRSLKGFDFIGG